MKLFFDTLITLGIAGTLIPALILLYNYYKKPSSWEARHKNISFCIAAMLLLGTITLIWGSFIEPRIIVTRAYEVDLKQIDKPITIAFISDMQIGTYKKTEWTEKIVKKIFKLNPDVVLLGGDHVDNMYYDEKEVDYLKPLEKITEKIPTYAIHGNHEYGIGGGKALTDPRYRVADVSAHTKKSLEAFGIRYLINELQEITINDQSFYLFGGDEYWAGKLNFETLSSRTKNIPTLGLVHNPSFIAQNFPTDIDVYLSGHTHGGQIRLPFIGPIGRVDNFLPLRYYKGLHTLGQGTKLLVTSGIGETRTRARLFNLPEIVLLTIK